MKQTALYLTIVFFVLMSYTPIAFVQETKFSNPILAGFYPDPSICRAGDDYYLVNSTFAYFPGVPVFHSTDLVNWRQIGNVLTRHSQINLDELGVSQGIYAPAIKYNKGTFYLITTLVGRGGNFVVTAKNPAGPWSDPYWLPQLDGIDPSLFFDDNGKAYVVYNSVPPDNTELYSGHRTIRMFDFYTKKNRATGKELILVNGGADISKQPIWIEGPHIYKKDGYYYLIAAEGGTSYNHSEVVFRSKSVKGPYSSYNKNPILTQRHLDPNRKYAITSTGHADIVETQKGEWWSVFLGCRPYEPYSLDYYNTGRETFMAPVKWIDGWPVINPAFEEVQYSYKAPDLPLNNLSEYPLNGNFSFTDYFDSKTLPFYWMFLRNPRTIWYSLSDNPSFLTVRLRPETCSEPVNPSMIVRRQQHAFCNASARMDFTPVSENEFAGIIAFQNDKRYYTIGKTIENEKPVIKVIQSLDAPERGKARMVMNPVKTVCDTALYKSERYGRDMQYSLPAEKGKEYRLTLKFAELYHERPGARMMNVTVNANLFLENFDINKIAGGAYIAVDTSLIIVSRDTVISIGFSTVTDNASICGIELKSADSEVLLNCGGDSFTGQNGKEYERDETYFSKISIEGLTETVATKKLTDRENKMSVFLKIEAKGDVYHFYYTFEEDNWDLLTSADGRYLSTASAGGFVGTMLGVYATSNGKSSANSAAYEWFTYSGNDAVFNEVPRED
jgi:xylan 1,4-beta-xylosidase